MPFSRWQINAPVNWSIQFFVLLPVRSVTDHKTHAHAGQIAETRIVPTITTKLTQSAADLTVQTLKSEGSDVGGQAIGRMAFACDGTHFFRRYTYSPTLCALCSVLLGAGWLTLVNADRVQGSGQRLVFALVVASVMLMAIASVTLALSVTLVNTIEHTAIIEALLTQMAFVPVTKPNGLVLSVSSVQPTIMYGTNDNKLSLILQFVMILQGYYVCKYCLASETCSGHGM